MQLAEFPNQAIDLTVLSTEDRRKFYWDCATYILAQYNQPNGANGKGLISKVLQNYKYFFAEQDFTTYNYITCDLNNNPIPVQIKKGNKLSELLSHLIGKSIPTIKNLKLSSTTINKKAKTKVDNKKDLELFKIEARELLNVIESAGVSIGGVNKNFSSKEDVEFYFTHDYKEKGQLVIEELASDIIQNNANILSVHKKFHESIFIAGYGAIKNEPFNNSIKQKPISPFNIIPDLTNDDETGESDQFVGEIYWETQTQIIQRYPVLAKSNRDKLNLFSTSEYLDESLLSCNINNVNHWHNQTKTVSRAVLYWKSMFYENNEKYSDIFKAERTDSDEPFKPYYRPCIRYAVVVGNSFLAEYGVVNNCVSDNDAEELELAIKVLKPNISNGRIHSMCDKLMPMQEEVDSIKVKLFDKIRRDLGKNYVKIAGEGGESGYEIINDLINIGLTTVKTANGDELSRDRRIFEELDFTLDPNTMFYVNFIRELHNQMDAAVHENSISLGQQTKYVTNEQYKGQQNQSSVGTSMVYAMALDYIERNLNFACNQYKSIIAFTKGYENPRLSDSTINYIKSDPDSLFELYGIKIKVNDEQDEYRRAILQQQLLAWSQNNVIPPDASLILQQENFTDDAYKRAIYMIRKERERQEQMALVAEQQKIMMQQQLEQMRQQGQKETAIINKQ